MIPFLDLKEINAQYREQLVQACANVIDSGWYVQGNEHKEFEKEFEKMEGNPKDALVIPENAKDGDTFTNKKKK